MFITKESDYAVRMIRALSKKEIGTVKMLSDEELVPHQYSYKILKKLEKAGLVHAYRGTNGGYALARPVSEMTLFDVLAAVEDRLLVTECLGHGFACSRNPQKTDCSVHREFAEIQDALLAMLRAKSLAEIFAR
ncbi:MAG: Rrf2 family transcriptional regulator [Spirochaetia bacterium]|jgi:Rrf2 family protein|nr:Rrf2 family transcriptional regulator [Spirochaetia bacterium]